MTNLGDLFDFDSIDETEAIEFEPLPAGEYIAKIREAELVDFKGKNNSDCQYLKIVFEVKDADYSGSKVWHRMTVIHGLADSDKGCARAQQIGRVQVKRLFKETGTGGSNIEDLIGRPIMIRTKLETYNDKQNPAIVDFYSAGAGNDDDLPDFLK